MKMNRSYFLAMRHLSFMLDAEYVDYDVERVFDGFIIRFPNGGDVIIHEHSYGHEKGLWESMGMPGDGNDVTGWLTAEAVIDKVNRMEV